MTNNLYVDCYTGRAVLREQFFFLMRKAIRIGERFPELEDVNPDDPAVQKLLDDFNAVTTELDQITELINAFPR